MESRFVIRVEHGKIELEIKQFVAEDFFFPIVSPLLPALSIDLYAKYWNIHTVELLNRNGKSIETCRQRLMGSELIARNENTLKLFAS